MSEVSDATQLLIITGKGAYLLGNITVKSAAMVLKVLNTIYLAKWKGKVSLNRFRRICGGDFLFINMGTEDAQILRGIEKEMKAHGILFSRLPDLCGGDGRTQYVIPPADMAKMKAFLLDHKAGKYGHIKVGPISPEDYAKTGIAESGRLTPELAELTQSALAALPEKTRRQDWRELVPVEEVLKVPEVWDVVKKHDTQINFGKHVSWIKGTPLKEHSSWSMYQMPDGQHVVIIPKQDIIAEKRNPVTGKVSPAEYAVFDARDYMVFNLKNGEGHLEKGKNVVLAMNRTEKVHSVNIKELQPQQEAKKQSAVKELQKQKGKNAPKRILNHKGR